jgi:ABC-type multidrug transport system ATPase subunit
MDICHMDHVLKFRGTAGPLGPIDLDVRPGARVGVVGGADTGKTTLLRLLWGFLRPDHGHVQVLGRTPHLCQLWLRHHAGFMGRPLWTDTAATGATVLEHTATFYPNWNRERAWKLACRLGLDLDRRVDQMRPVDQRRLAFAGAVAHGPRIWFLDEPLSGLDMADQAAIRTTLADLGEGERATVVVTATAADDLDGFADTLLCLQNGTVVDYRRLKASACPV